ncbi:unnamed protein product [Linum tenue]|uniref:Uncharacterized protein n=1 Tax=Linum tenue TaxID=586396 RepID=A0AAV0RJK0_9ROSI|nr:unnamed protein product [Linum tenue]
MGENYSAAGLGATQAAQMFMGEHHQRSLVQVNWNGFEGKQQFQLLGGGANSVTGGYTKGDGLGAEIVGTFVLVYTVFSATDANQQGSIRNDTALQLMYRIDVAGQGISPDGGTGMYRQWSPDDKYLNIDPPPGSVYYNDSVPLSSIYSNDSIQLQYRNEIHKLVAPATVYRTARGMSNISDQDWIFVLG